MPSAPGVSSSEAKKLEAKKKQAAEAKAKKKAYEAKAAPDTVEELVDANELEAEWFKEGDWKPSWGHVEFVSVKYELDCSVPQLLSDTVIHPRANQ